MHLKTYVEFVRYKIMHISKCILLSEGKITECWLVETEGIFFLVIFLSKEGKITDSWLAKLQNYSHLIGWVQGCAICIL